MKLPPLRAVQYFEVVARLLSFSRAAVELNVSQSAVSHQIRLLEDFLGERLLLRQGRLLSLTAQGEVYFEGISAGLGQIAQSSEQLRGGGEMRIRLAVYSSFAVKWLIPRLVGLRQLYPELDLSLEMVAEDPELSDRVADCFITVSPKGPGYMHDLLYRERLMPVCSRRLWQQVEGEWPATLWQLPLLSIQAIYKEKGEDWRRWADVGGLTIAPRGEDAPFQPHSAGTGGGQLGSGGGAHQRLYAAAGGSRSGATAAACTRDRGQLLFCLQAFTRP